MAKSSTRTKNTTPTEEVTEMSDTVTTEAEVQPEAPATDVTPEAAPAAEATPKPVVDHEGNLTTAIKQYGSDKNLEALQNAYRSVPVAARGKAQGVALKNAMEGGIDLALLGEVLEAFNTLPTATKTTRVKPDLDPQTEGSIRLTGLMLAFDSLRGELGDAAFEQAVAWHNGGGGNQQVPAEFKAYVDGVTSSVVNGSKVKAGGKRGPRASFQESFKQLVDRGAIPVGAELKGSGDIVATVTPEGKIKTNLGEYDAPSAAAKIHTTKDGKETATNGWKYWTYNGKSIGDLRQTIAS